VESQAISPSWHPIGAAAHPDRHARSVGGPWLPGVPLPLPHVRVGILTGGGDCPGLNAVIRAIVRKGEQVYGDELIGFLDAWDGVIDRRYQRLDVGSLRGMLPKGGTMLGTRRGSPYDRPDGTQRVADTFRDLGLDALIVIGGNGSLSVACQLHADLQLPIVGVPKTIDNDVVGTDLTFGFTTAVQIATDAIDRLHTTAESHDRVMVVEVMGRHAGWIATHAGIAGGATAILIPEYPFDIEQVCDLLKQRHERGRYASIVVVAEGAEPLAGTMAMGDKVYDQFGHVRLGGIAETIAHAIEARTGFESRVVLLGHIQRGGTPTAFDRVLATRYGVEAIDAVHVEAWGKMTALRAGEIELVPLADTVGRTRPVDLHLYRDVASVFFG
jgi:ATP-dependent phosphofructokinase / diphosphate-dependent phosphofructokinase